MSFSFWGPLTILKNHWTGVEKLPVSFGKSAVDYLQEVQKEIAAEYATSHSLEHLSPEQQTFSESPGFSDTLVHGISLEKECKPKRLPQCHISKRLKLGVG